MIELTTVETASPFLLDTNIQYAWDSTSIGYLKTCPRLYQYVMIEGWMSNDENIHLRFGQEYHTALEDYDKLRVDDFSHEEAVYGMIKLLHSRIWDWKPNRQTKAGKYKHPESLMRSVIWYADKFKDDPAETVILANGKPAVELSFRFEMDTGLGGSAPPFILCGHLDRVVEFNNMNFVLDRKTTTTTLSDYFFSQFDLSNQMTLYTLAGKVILNTPIKGVIIDGAQLLMEETAFQRGFTYRTEDQLMEWQEDLFLWFSLAENYALAGHWPMNDTSCDKYGGCRFKEVCSKSPGVREIYLKSNFTQVPLEDRWNPLRPR